MEMLNSAFVAGKNHHGIIDRIRRILQLGEPVVSSGALYVSIGEGYIYSFTAGGV